MQRRAAAAYVVFFVLIAAGSYAFLASAQSPTPTIDNPDHRLSQGDEVTIDGRTYSVTEVAAEESEDGGGHGGGGGTTFSGTLAWTNESASYTESFEAGGSLDIENTTYDVVIPNESDPSTATLREQANETVERNGQTFVVTDTNGDGTDELVPIDEYDALERIELSEDEPYTFRGNQSSVAVTQESVTFQWTAPRTNTVSLSHEANATLNGQQYFVFFESGSEVTLTRTVGPDGQPTQGMQAYFDQLELEDGYHERQNGFWGITFLSGAAAIFLTGLAYLPRKDT